ncbi:molybdopterin molybdotransferase MoeA [Pseudorhodobacter turbinis]|uniref:Molybdopterin molybdenumtransferase n=1 Tax=Pseudorhodobacter turbinis TaxID=2500533 RepID=A0A4P8EEX5_9RHOB|nr:gephyrin-like molybdotransferase Glp [Pseudorhodobacter turbinis]QCO54985.1 molybdopterin molybdotransferase MoeA [Pseudorhodobacter turbinis]
MISVDEALALSLGLVRPLEAETLPLAQAAGRYMVQPATARRDQPPFAASAMDGYAIRGPALPAAQFDVVGEASAGHAWAGTLTNGQALRIFTGAPVPAGADQVVIQENVTRDGDRITLGSDLGTGRNIRPQGADFKAGDSLSARLLRATDLALLASMNVAAVCVTRRPVVAIIATGDELVMPGETPRPDQIIASNSFALAAMAQHAGAITRMLPIARDTEASLHAVFALAQDADLIVTIGGASVGDHDLVGKVAADLGMKRAFYKIAMRPGKPLMAGMLNGTPMLGLPGNPISSVVCGHLFMMPMIRAMQGMPAPTPILQHARLTAPLDANGNRAHYMRAEVQHGPQGPEIRSLDNQDSALLTVLSAANALLLRPIGDGPRAIGEMVEYLAI